MLQRLGKWLRSAGYDTEIAIDAEADYYLLRQTIEQNRILITRDKALSRHRRAKHHVIRLQSQQVEDCVRELAQHIHINWLFDPFSRCLNCNSLLTEATSEQIHLAPKDQQAALTPVYYCPHCQQIFWDGSHVRRMRNRLEQWAMRYPVEDDA